VSATGSPPAPPLLPSRIRVLIADDHVTVREGLAAIIGRQPDMAMVAEAATGKEAVQLWHQHRPDVGLLDLRMPELDGIQALAAIRRQQPAARLIVLTTFDTDQDVSRAIGAGAKGYLLKDAPREEMLDGIRRVHAGATVIPPALVAKLAAGVSSVPLTAREHEVLQLLARGCANREIAGRLFVSETTVKSHLRSLFSKLQVINRAEAIAVAAKRGLVRL
jgi:two-component system NarL family response regulator